jgi:2-dehydro-3-deoxyphosphogluconate aldolase/(4S)-4-hydroxy-2-oxoglutarate aldolase
MNQADAILARMNELKVGAIIRTTRMETARSAIQAVVNGGFRMVEFTLTTPRATELIREFAARSDLLVGAGTVMTAAQVEESVAAGARFIVSPIVDEAVVTAALRCGVVAIPGTYTPTEMVQAARFGAQVVKLFPAPHDIAGYVRQILGPLPDLRIFPTAGVTPENFEAILAAGAFGVGFVSSLFAPADVASGNWAAIRQRAEGIIARLGSIRQP